MQERKEEVTFPRSFSQKKKNLLIYAYFVLVLFFV